MPSVRREHELWNGGREPIAEPALADDFARNLWNSQLELLALWPVSYTHLDVYKRQPKMGPN